MRKTLLILGCIATLLLGACTGESSRPVATGKGAVRAINTIPTSPAISFLIEKRTIGLAEYSNATSRTNFDDLGYIFNFQALLPDSVFPQRIASSFVNVVKDNEYTFLITGDMAAPTIIVWEDPIRIWEGTETTFQARFSHTAESLGPIDVYFAAPGILPAAGQEIGTLAFGELLSAFEYEPGDFSYTVTTAGDPSDILFTSDVISPSSRVGILLTVFDSTANNPGPLAGRLFTDTGASNILADINILSTVRFIHASAALDPSDVFTDDLLLDQILTNHAYRDVTGDIDLASGVYTFTYTSVGNVGSILFEDDSIVPPSTHSQFYVFGKAGVQSGLLRVTDRRSVETLNKLTFVHTATNHPLVDFYIVNSGESIDDAFPRFIGVPPLAIPIDANIVEGEYDLYLTKFAEKTVIAGPVPASITLGEVLEYISYDNVDPATADLVLIPLP
jgi:hypothetical protein